MPAGELDHLPKKTAKEQDETMLKVEGLPLIQKLGMSSKLTLMTRGSSCQGFVSVHD